MQLFQRRHDASQFNRSKNLTNLPSARSTMYRVTVKGWSALSIAGISSRRRRRGGVSVEDTKDAPGPGGGDTQRTFLRCYLGGDRGLRHSTVISLHLGRGSRLVDIETSSFKLTEVWKLCSRCHGWNKWVQKVTYPLALLGKELETLSFGSNLSRLAPIDMIDMMRSGRVSIGWAVMSLGYIDGKGR